MPRDKTWTEASARTVWALDHRRPVVGKMFARPRSADRLCARCVPRVVNLNWPVTLLQAWVQARHEHCTHCGREMKMCPSAERGRQRDLERRCKTLERRATSPGRRASRVEIFLDGELVHEIDRVGEGPGRTSHGGRQDHPGEEL